MDRMHTFADMEQTDLLLKKKKFFSCFYTSNINVHLMSMSVDISVISISRHITWDEV